jgi:hypothetical protein
MGIVQLAFAYIPIWVWVVAVSAGVATWAVVRNAIKDRESESEIDAVLSTLSSEHRWEPKMIGGTDYGKWVRKDGRPVRS